MKCIEPYTDKDMEWDGTRYVLTIAYIKDNCFHGEIPQRSSEDGADFGQEEY